MQESEQEKLMRSLNNTKDVGMRSKILGPGREEDRDEMVCRTDFPSRLID